MRFALVASFILGVAPLTAQKRPVIEGRLHDSATRRPIANGTVALLDSALAVVTQVMTDDEGAFRLEAPRPGDYFVLAHSIGYRRVVDGIIEMQDGGYISIDVYLRPEPLEMDSLLVEARRQRSVRHLESVGFYERRQAGFGQFLTPEQIERLPPPLDVADLLRRIPGVRMQPDGAGGFRVRLSGGCVPRLYIDGLRTEDVALNELVSEADIEGVEVYTGAAVPLQYSGTQEGGGRSPGAGGCGVVLVWSRK
ncbi:MAG: carboxypeptidase regulatory-like domain-containing protein [Gemmatimonadetes bacterium]|nr:carboxypeptidase regulatory-like domain-containing protein [Gemmatimonadota bacterium]